MVHTEEEVNKMSLAKKLIPALAAAPAIYFSSQYFFPQTVQALEAEEGYQVTAEGEFYVTPEEPAEVTAGKDRGAGRETSGEAPRESLKALKKAVRRTTPRREGESRPRSSAEAGAGYIETPSPKRTEQRERGIQPMSPEAEDMYFRMLQRLREQVRDDYNTNQEDLREQDGKIKGIDERHYELGGVVDRLVGRVGQLGVEVDALNRQALEDGEIRRAGHGLRLGLGIGPTFLNGTIYGTMAGRIGITLSYLAEKRVLRSIFLELEGGKLFGNYHLETDTERSEEISSVGPAYQQRNTLLEELALRETYQFYELARAGGRFPLHFAELEGELAVQMAGYHGEQKPSLRRESTTQLLDEKGNPLETPVTVSEETPSPAVATGRSLRSLVVGGDITVRMPVMTVDGQTISASVRGGYGRIVITNEGRRGNIYQGLVGVGVEF